MDSPITFQGHWWLPEDPGNRIAGSLTHDEVSGTNLIVLGSILKDSHFNSGRIDAICGISSNGRLITLIDCMSVGSTINTNGGEQHNISARIMAVGTHVGKDSVFHLKSLSFRCTNLEAWVDRHGFDINVTRNPIRFDVSYTRPESIHVPLPDGSILKIGFSVNGPRQTLFQTEMTISQKTWITVESPTRSSLEELWTLVGRVRNFLSLCVGRPVFITDLQATSDLATIHYPESVHYTAIDIYLYGIDRGDNSKAIARPGEVLLPLSSIQDHLEDALSSWFVRGEIIDPSIQLYFGTLYESTIHLNQHFLFLAQALETYHRRTSDDTDMAQSDHELRLASIIDTAPAEYKAWINSKLRYSNELSFRKRIKMITRSFSRVLGGYIKVSSFSSKVVNTRNYLTHYDPSGEDSAVTGKVDMLDLIFKLRTVLECCFMREIGLDDARIATALAEVISKRSGAIERNRQ